MGLRERKATWTREVITRSALTLFVERGFDGVTIEEIAAHAGVGTSTVYRYFPTKERLVLDPLTVRGQLSESLRSRPPDEPLAEALGHALVAVLEAPRTARLEQQQIEEIARSASSVGASLWEAFLAERTLLEQAIATRLGRSPDDVFCVVSARLATTVLELVSTMSSSESDVLASSEIGHSVVVLREVLARLAAEPPAWPTNVAPSTSIGTDW